MKIRTERRLLQLVATAGTAIFFFAPALLAAETTPAATVKTNTVDVRAEMSADSSVVKVLKKGDKVTVGLELQVEGNDWCEVSEPGSTARLGYVPCQALDRPAPPKAERAYWAASAGTTSGGVQMLLGKGEGTSHPGGQMLRGQTPPPTDKRFVTGNVAAPDFTLTGLDGRTHSLHDLRGHYVLLDFWATWCGPCRMEMPRLEELQREYAGRGLKVVGINSGESANVVRRFIAEHGSDYPILLDPQVEASREYDAEYIPTLVVIDPSGDVRFYDSGAYSERDLRAILTRVGLR